MNRRALCLLAGLLAGQALLAPPASAADDCRVDLGRGWPPATENYGSTVEQLFAGTARKPVLTLTRLPLRGVESGLQLFAGEDDADWWLRYSTADERVSAWSGGRLELRTARPPEQVEVPMPAALGRRVVTEWQRTLGALTPQDRAAEFFDDEVLLFVVDGLRVSGLQPGCGPGEELMQQLELMIDATGDDEEDRAERWLKLGESLDQLEQSLAGAAG
ncbi:hypothetical protein ACFOLC_05120 [Lysobacter cavernae]|uniref:Uncharacterized protein n=1 Tax=Lysobacter cavernae TaxID=1685901 RepID=A0ABV7RLY9_9GAMM